MQARTAKSRYSLSKHANKDARSIDIWQTDRQVGRSAGKGAPLPAGEKGEKAHTHTLSESLFDILFFQKPARALLPAFQFNCVAATSDVRRTARGLRAASAARRRWLETRACTPAGESTDRPARADAEGDWATVPKALRSYSRRRRALFCKAPHRRDAATGPGCRQPRATVGDRVIHLQASTRWLAPARLQASAPPPVPWDTHHKTKSARKTGVGGLLYRITCKFKRICIVCRRIYSLRGGGGH